MKTRRMTYKDHDITEEEAAKIIRVCMIDGPFIDGNGRDILRDAVVESNAEIADQLYDSIRYGRSYDKLSARDYIPLPKCDFYGYRRLSIANYNDLLRMYRANG